MPGEGGKQAPKILYSPAQPPNCILWVKSHSTHMPWLSSIFYKIIGQKGGFKRQTCHPVIPQG